MIEKADGLGTSDGYGRALRFFICQAAGWALMVAIDKFCSYWREVVIHEASPVSRGASTRLSSECSRYLSSRYFENCASGTMVNGTRCENLESLSFDDESIDLHVTQDVMEHLFHPSRAFSEITRTLRPGGMHIFSVPNLNRGGQLPSDFFFCLPK